MKKYTLLLPLVLAFVAILALNQCKKCPEEQKYLGNYPLGEVKDYLYFKPGSYWVYECDSTLELDSQVMIRIDTPWIRKPYIDYQYLTFAKTSISHSTSYTTYNPSLDIPYCPKCDNAGFSILLSTNSTNGGALDNVFYYPFDSTIQGGGGSSATHYKGYLSELSVLGKSYKDVRVFQYGSSGFPKLKNIGLVRGAQITLYWAKNIGIIRMFVQAGKDDNITPYWHNWNLKRYKLN